PARGRPTGGRAASGAGGERVAAGADQPFASSGIKLRSSVSIALRTLALPPSAAWSCSSISGAMSAHLVAFGDGRPLTAAWENCLRFAGSSGTFSYSTWSTLLLGRNSPVVFIH